MRLQGWDLEFYRGGSPFSQPGMDADVMQSMAGNSWNAFSYVSIKISQVGSVDWKKARIRMAEIDEAAKLAAKEEEQSHAGSDSSDDGVSDES